MTTKVSGNLIGSIPDDLRPELVLVAASLVDQQPVGLDTPLQVSFGPAQGTVSDPVALAADGTTTIQQDRTYRGTATFSLSRSTSIGEAILWVRLLVDGVQQGVPFSLLMTDDDMTIPLQFFFEADFVAGQILNMEIYRDSNGINNGGLTTQSSSIGWGTAPSAHLRMTSF